MTVDNIIKKIAKQQNTTPEHIRKEMEKAMEEAKRSQDPAVQARWAAIPRKGADVTLEEFLTYVAGIVNSIS